MTEEAQTPHADQVRRALDIMQQGARMVLDSIPGDASLSSSSFGADVVMDIAEQVRAKDAGYRERNALVVLLASIFPAGVKRTAIEGWSPEWHGCVYIDLPNGQASWHYHDSEAELFAHLPPYDGEWDGHTTEQKYERIRRLAMEDL
jgi:hypothetical protein